MTSCVIPCYLRIPFSERIDQQLLSSDVQVIYDDYYLFCFGYILVFGVDDYICSANSNILLTIPKQCFHCVSLLIAFL